MQSVTGAGEPVVFARNQLVIAVPKGNPKGIAGLADLSKPGLKVALCAEEVPCGAAAKKAGVAVPPVTLERDVKAALAKVKLGEVDAALVYRTDAKASATDVDGVEFAESASAINDYPIVVLKDAPNAAAAQGFLEHVRTEGLAVLTEAGFRVDPDDDGADGLVVLATAGPPRRASGLRFEWAADRLWAVVDDDSGRPARVPMPDDSLEIIARLRRMGVALDQVVAAAGAAGLDWDPADRWWLAPMITAGVAQVAAAHGITAQQVRLAWTLHQGDHVLAIPGTGSIAHLEQNVAAGSVRLSPADLALLG